MAPISESLSVERDNLLSSLKNKPSQSDWCVQNSDFCDRVVCEIAGNVGSSVQGQPEMALIATGGYGRREMSPHSDVDITLVPLDESAGDNDDYVRGIFQELHKAFANLRIEVGWSYRHLSDIPVIDGRTRTGLLDARLVFGSARVLDELTSSLWDGFPVGEFLLNKMTERASIREKHNQTPLVVEPNLKEGAGGLRSFHAMNWIRRAVGKQPLAETNAFAVVLQARNLLHLVSGRKNDMLSRQRQAEIAELLDIEHGLFMSNLHRALLELDDLYVAGLKTLQRTDFLISPGVRIANGLATVERGSDLGVVALGISQSHSLGFELAVLDSEPDPTVSGFAALEAIAAGEGTVRAIDRAGLLERLLPELTNCRTLLPDDNVHQYTVYEHSLQVLRNLDGLMPGSFLGDLKARLVDPQLLYLASLLHDVGKSDSSKPHSISGAKMAETVCKRWGLSDSDSATVEWLVREHLSMARFIRLRDIADPETVTEFTSIVGTVERLDALTLLTWADINAVAPDAWTLSQDAFLRELHGLTYHRLMGNESPEQAPNRHRLLRQLQGTEIDAEEVAAFVESLPAHYLNSSTGETAALHLTYFKKALRGEPSVEFHHQPDRGATELTVCVQDSHGLLSRLLGIIYALDITLLGIRASTTKTEVPVALDVFTISLSGSAVPPATCRLLATNIQEVLGGSRSVESLLLEKAKDPDRMQRDFSATYTEGSAGVLEVVATRGRGMAYRLSKWIARQGWDIVSARVGQWAGRGAAAFYLVGQDGRRLSEFEVSEALRNRSS